MKSPEEIKKGLAYCDSRDHMHNGCAGGCPYWRDEYGCHSTEMKIDALGYIQQLEERIAKLDKLASSRLRRMKLFRERASMYIKECVQLRNRVKKLEEQAQQWVSVKDRLPKRVPGRYLVSLHGEIYATMWEYDAWNEKYAFKIDHETIPGVTHWMKVSEPPKEG